jgi:hypothetical protein
MKAWKITINAELYCYGETKEEAIEDFRESHSDRFIEEFGEDDLERSEEHDLED